MVANANPVLGDAASLQGLHLQSMPILVASLLKTKTTKKVLILCFDRLQIAHASLEMLWQVLVFCPRQLEILR